MALTKLWVHGRQLNITMVRPCANLLTSTLMQELIIHKNEIELQPRKSLCMCKGVKGIA